MPFYLFLSHQQSHLSSRLRSSSMTDGVSDQTQPPTPTVHLLFSSSPLPLFFFTHSTALSFTLLASNPVVSNEHLGYLWE